MTYPLVTELADEGVPVVRSCEVLGFSTQGYYKWVAKPYSDRDYDDACLLNAIHDIHAADPAFGYRFIADELGRRGIEVGEGRVQRLCAENGIVSITVRKGRTKRPGAAVHDDHVNRDFTAERPDQVWLTDITEHPTSEGKLYLCAIKDVASRRIVGYALGPRMTSGLAVAALRTAIARRQPACAVIVHSDRGSQFRSRPFIDELARHSLVGSMGRVAAAGDNAAMESFFALLQRNVLNTRTWRTREDLTVAIITWIERTYHRRRRQRALGKLTPIEYETLRSQPPALEAA